MVGYCLTTIGWCNTYLCREDTVRELTMDEAEILNMKPEKRQVLIAMKVVQMHDVDIPEIKSRLRNGDESIEDHEIRLTKIETKEAVKRSILGSKRPKQIGIAGGILTVILSIIYGIGANQGWWA
tara:strand:+ start:28 stop:402 length:375 start_codon:yes stop_codon:yes gene_type:complete